MVGARQARMLFLPAVALLFASCSDQPTTPPEGADGRIPARIEILSGQDQVAIAGSPLPSELKLRVVDTDGEPVGGQLIAYEVTSGAGMVQTDTVLTNSEGIATGSWILGPEPGDNVLEARLVSRSRFWPRIIAIFRARGVRRAERDRATAIEVVSGQDQSGTVGTELPEPLVVKVLDRNGQPVSGQEVSYQVTSGGGSLSASKGVTDDKGTARVRLTLGSNPGKNTVVARISGTSAGSSAPSVTFNAEGVAKETTPPTSPPPPSTNVGECANPGTGWIWCDDFEEDRLSKYFEYDNANGSFVRAAGVGVDGSHGMRVQFSRGQVNAGSIKLAFGLTPQSYFRPVDDGRQKYREVYWRFYIKNASNWTGGGGDKLSRAASMSSRTSWAESMIAHVWSGGSNHNYITIDPASGTDTQGNLRTTKYNDFDNLRWLGAQTGRTPIFDRNHVGEWYCVEVRARLNDPGQSNGVFEYWINGEREARREGLNWVGSFDAYGINVILLENYWNNGSPQAQERYIDNFVVSTRRIGCGTGDPGTSEPGPGPSEPNEPPPAPVVTTVSVSPSTASIVAGQSATVTATVRDQDGRVMEDERVTWRSSNTGVARVSSTGRVTGRIEAVSAGTATITAEVDGKSARVSVTVTQPATEPPPSSSVEPWLEVDPSKFADTNALRSACNVFYGCIEDFGINQISLDRSTGYGGRTGAMRYDWTNQGCSSRSVGRGIRLPAPAREIWAEFAIKWSPNFYSYNSKCPPGAHKLIFGQVTPDMNGRWNVEWGQGGPPLGIHAEWPGMNVVNMNHNGEQYWDGEWHVVRIHWKHSTTSSSNDGIYEMWVDGRLVYSNRRLNTPSGTAIQALLLGRNKDKGIDRGTESLWWGLVRVWNRNPGW